MGGKWARARLRLLWEVDPVDSKPGCRASLSVSDHSFRHGHVGTFPTPDHALEVLRPGGTVEPSRVCTPLTTADVCARLHCNEISTTRVVVLSWVSPPCLLSSRTNWWIGNSGPRPLQQYPSHRGCCEQAGVREGNEEGCLRLKTLPV